MQAVYFHYVGDFSSSTFASPSSPFSLFHKTVRERVDTFFKENNIVSLQHTHSLPSLLYSMPPVPSLQDPKISYWMFFRYFVFFATANLFWLGMVRYRPESVCLLKLKDGFFCETDCILSVL